MESKTETENEEGKNYELECLVRSIKEVEMAKSKKPEMYAKALEQLKGEAKVIGSIADLKAVRKKKTESDEE